MINPENAMRQATYTAEYYMEKAKLKIDEFFGDGYAMNHPSLVSSFMHVCALDFKEAMENNRHEELMGKKEEEL